MRLALTAAHASLLSALLLHGGCGGGGGGGGGGTITPPGPTTGLLGLSIDQGQLSPEFQNAVLLYSSDLGHLTPWTFASATSANPAASLAVNGFPYVSGALSQPILLPIGVTPVLVSVTEPQVSGSTDYSVAVTRQARVAATAGLVASNAESGDEFGRVVASDGDTLVVGAWQEDGSDPGVNGSQALNGLPASGAVYVFSRGSAGWVQQAYLKASNPGAGDQFGFRVALSGNTIAVGAPEEDSSAVGVNGAQGNNGATDSGAVYVFVRDGTTWAQQAYIKASNTGTADHFGCAVALSGETLVVGAYGERSLATGVGGDQSDDSGVGPDGPGAVYVFTRAGETWGQQAYIKASNTEVGDLFGHSVSVTGDRLAVGAPGEASSAAGSGGNQADNSRPRSGAVYVFDRTGALWSQSAYLKASNPDSEDAFGHAISLDGGTLAVGAYLESSGATGVDGNQASNSELHSGSVYVFTVSGSSWAQQAYVKAMRTVAGADFGECLSLQGDILAVGVRGESGSSSGVDADYSQQSASASSSGAAYIYERASGVWSFHTYIKAESPQPGARFGSAVALWRGGLAVGVPGEASSAGRVATYR